jgi:hypothetical protein
LSTIFISFYNAYPVTSGSSYITTNLFELWPDTKKSLFLFTHEKNRSLKSNIFSYNISSNHSLIKIINLPFYLFFILKNINISKKINIFFEGASWIGFAFIFFIILKFLNNKIRFIYHAHNVDYDLRKKNIIGWITFKMERFIIKNLNVITAVSKKDQKRFFSLYKIKPCLLENGIHITKIIKKYNVKKNFFFSGSLLFDENKFAFNKLTRILNKSDFFLKSKYYLNISGNNKKIKFENKYIINLGILNYKKYISKLQSSKLCLYPMRSGPGTKIKILEALCHRVPVLTTMAALRGIDIKYKKLITYKNQKEMDQKIIKIVNNKIDFSPIYNNTIAKYDFKKIINRFYTKNKF